MIYEAVDRWNSPYIEHHGVKGMKWGVRKQRQSLGDRIQAYRTKRHEDYIRKTFGEAAVMEGRREDSIVYKRKGLTKGQKTALKVGVGVVVVAGAAAMAYALKKYGATSVRKLPKMNIIRGKSTVRSIDLNEEYRTAIRNTQMQEKLREYVRSDAGGIIMKDYTARYNPQLRSKLGAATENYARSHDSRSNLWSYRPVYTTNSGNRITKRLGRR